MANKFMKRWSASLIREMQIKTPRISHLTLASKINTFILKKKKTSNNKYWQGCRDKRILVHCCWKYKFVQSLMKIA